MNPSRLFLHVLQADSDGRRSSCQPLGMFWEHEVVIVVADGTCSLYEGSSRFLSSLAVPLLRYLECQRVYLRPFIVVEVLDNCQNPRHALVSLYLAILEDLPIAIVVDRKVAETLRRRFPLSSRVVCEGVGSLQ